jgi:hypothetical protein
MRIGHVHDLRIVFPSLVGDLHTLGKEDNLTHLRSLRTLGKTNGQSALRYDKSFVIADDPFVFVAVPLVSLEADTHGVAIR